jgi:hypothetical protein
VAADFGDHIVARGPAKAEGQQRERRSAGESNREVVVPSMLSLQQASDSCSSTATNETPKPRLNCCDMPAKSHGHDYDVVPVLQTG